MKKLFAVVLTVIFLLAIISGCGKTGNSESGDNRSGIPEETKQPGEDNQQDPDNDGQPDQEENDAGTSEKPEIDTTGSGDAGEERFTVSDEYFKSQWYYDNLHETYIQRDFATENRLPKYGEFYPEEQLYIYMADEIKDTEVLRRELERFIECFGVKPGSVSFLASGGYTCQALTAVKEEDRITGTPAQDFDGVLVNIISNGFNLTVNCTPKEEMTGNGTEVEFMENFVRTDAVSRAMCAYAGISEPELFYAIEYNCDGEKSAEYYICEASGGTQKSPEGMIRLSFDNGGEVRFITTLPGVFKQGSCYQVKTMEDAVGSFCAENGIDMDSILDTGFAYAERYYYTYVPCYLVLLPGDNEFAELRGMDLSVYQEYDLLAIPAVEIE